jgi:hypothetical protein
MTHTTRRTTNTSRLAAVLRWQAAGMVVTLAVPAMAGVGQAMLRGEPLLPALRLLPGGMVLLLAAVVLITPLSLLVLWGGVAWRVRVPAVGATLMARLLSSVVLACVLALLAGVVSHWELLVPFAGVAVYVREALDVAGAVLPWSVLGVVGGAVVGEVGGFGLRGCAVAVGTQRVR